MKTNISRLSGESFVMPVVSAFKLFVTFWVAIFWFSTISVAAVKKTIPTGVWKGSYVCQQGKTGLTLTLAKNRNGAQATFRFYPLASNPRVPEGLFTMTPRYNIRNRKIKFAPKAWIKRPSTYRMVSIKGRFSRDLNVLSGRILTRGCGKFRVIRIESRSLVVTNDNDRSTKRSISAISRKGQINPFAKRAKDSKWFGRARHQNGKTFKIRITKRAGKVLAEYPETSCGSILIPLSSNSKSVVFKEKTRPGFRNCIDGGEITLTQKFRNLLTFSWKGRGKTARGALERISENGGSIIKLAEKPFKKSQPSVNAGSSRQASINTENLQGDWYGIAACRRKLQKINVELYYRGGTNKGFVRSFARNIKIRLDPEGSGRFRLIRGKGKRGKISHLVAGKKTPQFLDLKFPGQCKSIFLVRHQPIKGIGGQYARTKRQNIFCDLVFERWLKTDNEQRDLAFKLKQQYSPLLNGYDYKKSAKQAIFSDPVFTKFFGKPASKIGRDSFEKLDNQIRGCIATKDYWGEIYAGTELFTARSIKKVIHGILRTGEFSGRPLSETAMYSDFKVRRELPRPTAFQILGDWKSLLSETDPVGSIRQLIKSKARELSQATPEDISETLKQISATAAAAKQASPKMVSSLAGRKPSVMLQDHLEGYTLLEAPFGHYIYVKKGAINSTNCRSSIPVRVRLSSLLNLKYLRKKAAGGFFFYALDTIETACRSLAGVRAAKKVRANFFFDGKKVGSASVTKESYRVRISDIKLLVKPDVHPKDHPDFLFDKAAAAILGLSDGLSGTNLPELTLADLKTLAKRGDLQAMTVLGLNKVHKIGNGKTANSTLIYALRRVPDMNKNLMRQASDNGSIVASYLLALELARSKKLFKDHAQSGVDISELQQKVQADFIHWYAKARAGEVFYYRYLENVIKRWDVPVAKSLQQIAKQGFKGGTPHFQIDVNAQGLSKGRVRKSFNKYILSRCNKIDRFVFAEDHGNNPAAVLLGSYEVRGNACFAKMGGPYPFQIIQSVDRVSKLRCSGSKSNKTCTFVMKLECRWNSSSNDRAAQQHAKLVLGAMCRVFEIPVPVTAQFARGVDGWSVVGKPQFGK